MVSFTDHYNVIFIDRFPSKTNIGKDLWYFNNTFLCKSFLFSLNTHTHTHTHKQKVTGGKSLTRIFSENIYFFKKIL